MQVSFIEKNPFIGMESQIYGNIKGCPFLFGNNIERN